ncbi:hypothetical protein BUALT_Bualt04G0029100 [Buddleja alternifolia]|uniref:DUF4283 domain-containing protein n=1 Tax=Buddleja alternifolia TaxID=168488 RepID=A0AAV6XKU1_9LAMI|nr:hypothetical protein BUALT_Bualt04G0029100 [Buddleja alternifolia]
MEPSPVADHQGPTAVVNKSTSENQTSSYAEKLKGNLRPTELAARVAKRQEDDFIAAPYQYYLVGKFSHGYPTMTRLRAKFAALGLNSGFKIGVLDNKHVWIRLFDPNDYARVWMKQTWYFDGFPMRVLKWTSDFNPTEESPIMPIWIKVFGLRPHWFHRQFLYHVASLIGKPLKLDEATTEIDNPVVARMCVEVNVLKKLHQDVPIQIDGKIRFFKVQYEGIPEYCRIYRHRGHSVVACFAQKNNPEDEEHTKEQREDQESRETGDLRVKLDKNRGKRPMVRMVEPTYILARNQAQDKMNQ